MGGGTFQLQGTVCIKTQKALDAFKHYLKADRRRALDGSRGQPTQAKRKNFISVLRHGEATCIMPRGGPIRLMFPRNQSGCCLVTRWEGLKPVVLGQRGALKKPGQDMVVWTWMEQLRWGRSGWIPECRKWELGIGWRWVTRVRVV